MKDHFDTGVSQDFAEWCQALDSQRIHHRGFTAG
jgi:hypothetical protein